MFLDIRAAFPTMSIPEGEHRLALNQPPDQTNGSVPIGQYPRMEDRACSSLSQEFASAWAAFDLCKTYIASTPRKLPGSKPFESMETEKEFQERLMDPVRVYLERAYEAIRYPAYAPLAARLLEPYLRMPDIQKAFATGLGALYSTRVLDRIPMLELLIEAHELTLPEELPNPITVTERMTLLDVISRHETYSPVTSHQTFFPFGSRIGSASIRDYSKAWTQLRGDSVPYDSYMIARACVELVLCVVKHLRGR